MQVNGERREVASSLSISELLEQLGVKTSGLVVELNGEVVHRSDYGARQLKDRDMLEILQMVGGG